MHALSRYAPSGVFAALVTISLFLFMQALVSFTPVDIPKPEVKKPVPIYKTKLKPPQPPPPPEGPEVTKGSPDVPVITVHPPQNPSGPVVVMENPGLPRGPGPAGMGGDSVPYIIVSVPPPYPQTARMQGVEGIAVVEFTVNPDGTVSNPVVVEEEPSGYGFGSAAMRAILAFKFQPRVVDGTAVSAHGIKQTFEFMLTD